MAQGYQLDEKLPFENHLGTFYKQSNKEQKESRFWEFFEMNSTELKKSLQLQKSTLEYLMNFSHPAILQNQKLLARQFLDICNNFLNIQNNKSELSTIITQQTEILARS